MVEPSIKLIKDQKQPPNYFNFLVLPLKFAACWEWFDNPKKEYQFIINYVYLSVMLSVLLNVMFSLTVHIYLEWAGFMSSLDMMSESLPIVMTLFIIGYFSTYQNDLYDLVDYANKNFKWQSAYGVTNMTMQKSYDCAKRFAHFYTACLLFTVTWYTIVPLVSYMTNNSDVPWMYKEVNQTFFIILHLLRHVWYKPLLEYPLGNWVGVFFVASSILLCGQLDLLCCSLRNVRYTALLKNGIQYRTLLHKCQDIQANEEHCFSYNESVLEEPGFIYNRNNKTDSNISYFDIYDPRFDDDTCSCMEDCARVQQVIKEFKLRFEKFISPILVVRILQYTVYLCILLYSATLKFDLAMFEYLFAVALDMFFHCYFGNQIIIQSDRVSEAAYQSAWITMGARPRRVLLNIMLSSRRPLIVRAVNFMAIDLQTFITILKTSFSYYTLLVNVNEK